MSIYRKLFSNYLISSALISSHTHRLTTPLTHTLRAMSSSAPADEFCMAYVTAPDTDVAKDIAKYLKLVSAKLVACVNIVPAITSVYEWKGNIETDSEVLMIIKTRSDRIEELTTMVKANHPYEVFELISTPIQNGNPDYLKWLGEVVPKRD